MENILFNAYKLPLQKMTSKVIQNYDQKVS